ncbi:unnamed protein product [Rotaria sordida]|uniref:Uncharacterized protein n=1 Tax=Rotaria sordida TaxID=392033 RepID=A0A814N0L2_9BILA|nr:unnamed protein product [Rotaria sordida]
MILSCTETSALKKNDSTWARWIATACDLFLSILSGFGLSSLINYYQQRKVKSILQVSTEQIMSKCERKLKFNKHIPQKTLSEFVPLPPYRVIVIQQQTSPVIVNELIIEARKTNRFTIHPYDYKSSGDHYLEIEFLQQSSSSIIISIEIFHQQNLLFERIDDLLSIILHPSNMIYTWEDFDKNLIDYQSYQVFLNGDINRCHFVNVQNCFKTWYNTTFGHNQNCNQLLDFNDIDGPLCSCSHRPVKCPTEQWSLTNAIAYTFHQNFSNGSTSSKTCPAITKLFNIIQNNWTRQQIEYFRKQCHINSPNG